MISSDDAMSDVPSVAPAAPDDGPPGAAGPLREAKRRKTPKNLKSPRAVDTMFRTAYREQLDHTALADSKANIMIQLNGVIISIMLASSSLVVTSHAWLLLPWAALTLTSLLSIVFAVLAARPNLDRRAGVTSRDVRVGRANILFFGNFGRITEDEFVAGMVEMMAESEQVYLTMTRHLHGLGTVLLRKFRLLRIAYTVFLGGLFVSTALFVLRLSMAAASPALGLGFQPLPGAFEPSGVVQLEDGRILIVEDEPERAMGLWTFGADGGLEAAGDLETPVLDDLEGAARAGRHLFAITSFDGRGPTRERLIRFELPAGTLADVRTRDDLRGHLRPFLGPDFNVEALAVDHAEERLLLGIRAPLRDGKAQVLPIALAGLFDETPRVAPPILLDLDGAGIRAMAFDPQLRGLLIISAREKDGDRPHDLWLWTGDGAPRLVRVDGTDLRRAEGIAPVRWEGRPRLLVVSDEGHRKKGRLGTFLLLDYDQLHVDRT